MLLTLEEIQALAAIINKAPMVPAEQLWAQMIINRLLAYAQPPKPAKEEGGQPAKQETDSE